jgi:hypothetical protein
MRRMVKPAGVVWLFLIASLGGCSGPAEPEHLSRSTPSWQSGERIRYPAARYPTLSMPTGERRIVRSILNVDRPMLFGDYIWNEEGIPSGPTWVRIDLGQQTLSVFRAEHEIGTAVILFGTDGNPTPAGVFPILSKAVEHRSTLYDAQMPFMLRLTGDGVAIHASNVRRGSATHGCIGVPLAFAKLLYDQVHRGDQVVIVPADGGEVQAQPALRDPHAT